MEGFLIVRTYWDYSYQQSNSQELKARYDEARKRMFTILGGDIGKDNVAFEIVMIIDAKTGVQLCCEAINNRHKEVTE